MLPCAKAPVKTPLDTPHALIILLTLPRADAFGALRRPDDHIRIIARPDKGQGMVTCTGLGLPAVTVTRTSASFSPLVASMT